MKKLIRLLISLFLLAGLAGAGEWVTLTPSTDPLTVKVLESNDQHIVLQYQIAGFEREDIPINGVLYSFIGVDKESRFWEKGNPDLPRLCRSVIIPDAALMAAHIVAAQYQDLPDYQIAPSKGHLLRSVNPEDVPYEFSSVYQQDAWYPQETIQLRDPYILRDVRGQVIELNPYQYNPVSKTLRVYTDVTVELYVADFGGANVLNRTKPLTKMDPEFRQTYQRHFLNYDPDRYTAVDDIGPLLVITYDNFNDIALELVNWKRQKGIPTNLVNVSTIGNNSTAIKNYINNVYRTTGLAYVLLVGDAAQVATPGTGLDPTYGQLDGNDHYAEVFVGRFSAETRSQAITQVLRTINYEKLPTVGATWYRMGTGIASNQGAGIGHYGEADWQHMNLIRGDLLRYGYVRVDRIYDPTATQAMISSALNAGRGILNYCGHGSTTSWGTTGFSNTQINALTNDNMLAFMTSVACVNGAFISTTCFGEAWLRATHNGNPSGAIGFWGSSQSQSWAPPMYAQDEFVDLMVAETMHTYGSLCNNGASKMIDMCGATGNSEADHWIIFGDPSLQVRTDIPVNLSVTHAAQISFGQTTFSVTVAGQPGALAALYYNGNLLGYGYADGAGTALIQITGTLPQGQNVTLTATAFNSIPYISQLPVVGDDDALAGSGIRANQGATAELPGKFALYPAYPNPFNPTTAISYQLSAISFVNLSVYDISGKKIAELVNGWREAGSQEITFDGSKLSSGVYIYQLNTGAFSASGKMVLMK